MLQLRPQEWQGAVLVVAPFVLLIAYFVLTYMLVKRRSLGSALRKVVAAAVLFTLVWVMAYKLLFYFAWMGTSDVSAVYSWRMNTLDATTGWPLHLFDRVPFPWQVTGTWGEVDRVFPLFLMLLGIAVLIVAFQRAIAGSRFAIEKQGRLYLGSISGLAVAILLVLLWPQPLRNPEMPSVPILDDAIGVRYLHTADEDHWPVTAFGLEDSGVNSTVAYYQEALADEGWKLEYREANLEPVYGSGMITDTFSLDNSVLQMTAAGMYSLSITFVKKQATKTELAQLAALPKPTATPTLEPAPSPVETSLSAFQTAVSPVVTVVIPAGAAPLPTTERTLLPAQK